jgi:phospholipase C
MQTRILTTLLLLSTAWSQNFVHVVLVVQENRTPDNLFQGLCNSPFGSSQSCSTTPSATQYNLQTSNWLDKTAAGGVTQPQTVVLASAYDLSHSHSSWLAQCDRSKGRCLMDGAASVPCIGGNDCPTKPQFRYVYDPNYPTALYPYLTLATQYGWANYMFQTNQGPSLPAHQFIFGGTSAPTEADDAAGIFAISSGTYKTEAAGCIAPESYLVEILSPTGITSMYPCFEHQTMADLMSGIGTWRYYTPSAGSIWNAPNAISHLCQSTGYGGQCTGWDGNVVVGSAQIFTDIADCRLANLSWVIPTGNNSDHPGGNTGGGPDWVASIVNAIGNNPSCPNGETYWNDTAIIITWDDWGGWYDHEPPQILPGVQGDFQYGFRVPLIFVSAYTPVGYIDNDPEDFGSVLRFVQQNFGLLEGSLNFADARAVDDLNGFVFFQQAPRVFSTIPTQTTIKSLLQDKSPATDPDDD